MPTKYFLSLIWLIVGFCVKAQNISPLYSNFQHYTTEDGLPQNYVSYLAQDHDGFIWVGTLNGLARFDGKHFLQFNSNANDSLSLSTSQIIDVMVDEQNKLWILHFNMKVDLMNPRTFEITKDVKPVKSIRDDHFRLKMGLKTSKLIYFLSDNAKKHWYIKDQPFYHLFDSTDAALSDFFQEATEETEQIYGFDIDSLGGFWTMTAEGLEWKAPGEKIARKIPVPESFGYAPGPRNKSPIVCLAGGRVLFGYGSRLFIFNSITSDFKEVRIPIVPEIRLTQIFFMIRDLEKRPVFEYQGFIFRLEEDDTVTTLWAHPERETFQTTGLLIDKTNTLWVGVNTGGLFRVDLNMPSFNSKKYEANFLVDVLTREIGVSIESIPPLWKVKSGAYGLRYFQSENYGTLLKYDYYQYTGKKEIYRIDAQQLLKVPVERESPSFFVGLAGNTEAFWSIDGDGFIYKWDDLSAVPTVEKFGDFFPEVEKLNDLVVDDENQWVISVENKLYQLKSGEIIGQFSPASDNVSLVELCQDPIDPSTLWISTLGGGLIKWNKDSLRTISVYSKKDGLSDNSIGAIVPDQSGNLWLSTFNGISKFNTLRSVFTNYSKQHGLVESEFNRHHSFQLPDGRIALGGTVGYSVFDPAYFKEDLYHPEIQLTELSVNNKKLNNLALLEHLDLKYNENAIALEMAAMEYNNPQAIRYRYQLVGYNQDWVDAGDQRAIRFDNLAPGNYTLQLNSTNTNGRWSDNIKVLTIKVSPPFWLSWWAYTIYLLATVFFLFVYWKSYQKRLVRKQEEEFNRREAKRLKEMDDIKTRFFSNITHEFRTPLALILSPLERQLRKNSYPGEIQQLLQNNYRHGSHLLKLVNELLDISKLEAGFMQQHVSTGQLSLLGRTCVEQFSELAQEKEIDLSFDSTKAVGYYQFDRSHLEKIITNLLSNAIKFTPKGGKVTLVIEEMKGGKILIMVEDTGIGIPDAQLPMLFDRFFQVDDSATRSYGGTGIGLSLVKELTDLMGGQIEVRSEVGSGSVFQIVLPIPKIAVDRPTVMAGSTYEQAETPNLSQDSPLTLVVEDNDDLRAFVAESLRESWKVIEAKNGVEGLEALLEYLPDVVVSDVMMPEMDGYELCSRAKQDLRTSHIHFIMLTAKTAQESKLSGLEAGADDYLTKPFHMYELELRIQNALIKQQNLRDHLKNELLPPTPNATPMAVNDAFLTRLYEFVERNLADRTLKIEAVAEAMGMSKSTLSRKIKVMLDISISELIKRYRLQRAVEKISAGDKISAVAFAVGFETHSYFSQVFKDTYGTSPSDYQDSLS